MSRNCAARLRAVTSPTSSIPIAKSTRANGRSREASIAAIRRFAEISAKPSSSSSCPRAQLVEVGGAVHEPALEQHADLLLAEPVDVHRAARDEVAQQLPLAARAVEVRAVREDRALRLDRRRVADRAARRHRAAAAGGPGSRPRAAPARRPAGSRRRRAARSPRRPRAGPCGRGPPRCAASPSAPSRRRRGPARARRTGAGRRTCRRSSAPRSAASSRSSAGTSRPPPSAGRGRPTPSRRWSSKSETLTTTPSISKSSAAAAALPLQALRDDRLLVVEHDDLAVDREAVLAKPLEHLPLVGQLEPLDDADRVGPHRQRPLRGERRVELADRAGRRVARVHERREALRRRSAR